MELSLGLFFGNQGQIGQPLSEEISLLKCSSRSKQKILGLHGGIHDSKSEVVLLPHEHRINLWYQNWHGHKWAFGFSEKASNLIPCAM